MTAGRTNHTAFAEPAEKMEEYSFDVMWRYVVPPHNDMRIVISQRQEHEQGHYYVSVEEYRRGMWMHVTGSSIGALSSFDQAFERAETIWNNVKKERNS